MTYPVLPALVAAGAVVAIALLRPGGRNAAGVILAGVSALSLLTTALVAIYDPVDVESTPGLATQVEAATFLVLIALSARWAPSMHVVASTALAAAAVGLIVLRFRYPGDDDVAILGGIVAWAAVALGAALLGWHFRALDDRRLRAVLEAQRRQRIHLARDLHDFVAHDVSEMLAQAQAGQVLSAGHAAQCTETFAKIEEAAQRALRSMDQTVLMLQDTSPDDASTARRGTPLTLAELPELVERFADANGIDARLDLDGLTPDEVLQLPTQVSSTLYRVAVEALTNVRRHATSSQRVDVELRRRDERGGGHLLELVVADDGHGDGVSTAGLGRRNGLGLPTLAERVERLGGHFTAGTSAAGWEVRAVIPVPADGRWSSKRLRGAGHDAPRVERRAAQDPQTSDTRHRVVHPR